MSQRLTDLQFHAETLEPRCYLAGDVTVTLQPSGDVIVTGDGADKPRVEQTLSR